jgi:hypothetical protein
VATPCYLAEVTLRVLPGRDLEWIRDSLDAACRRLDDTSPSLEIVSAVHTLDNGRLWCLIRAASRENVLRLFEIALLPSARILEAVVVRTNSSAISQD